MEREIKRIAGAHFSLIPLSEKTHDHYTYNLVAFWK
jgi:hypothetical protein